MKKLIFLLSFCALFLSGMAQTNHVAIYGYVNDLSGNPIPNHPVTIQIDSTNIPGFTYYNVVNTGIDGLYIDSVVFNPAIPGGTLMVSTYDCNQVLYPWQVLFNAGNNNFRKDFQVCNADSLCNANFSWNTNGPLTIGFYNSSIGGGIWNWQFGDGATSTQQHPVHVYSQQGYYNVTLNISDSNASCWDSLTQLVYVSDSTFGGCHAAFNVYPDSSAHQFQFTDQSTGNINSWFWAFGDGATSTLQNPIHEYLASGTYIACLVVQGVDSTCYSTICDTINVGFTSGCQAYFSWYADTLNSQNTIHYFDQSTGGGSTWYWSFGDSTYSTLQNPVHAYANAGTYHVCLTITSANPYCSDSWCTEVNVGNVVNCQSYFNSMSNWLDLTFEGHKLNGWPASYSWSFGDGSTGTGQTVTHSFASPGYYTVSMTSVEDSTLCSYTSSQTILVGDSTNLQQIYGQVFAGTFPLTSGLAMIFSLDTAANTIPYFDSHVIDSAGVYYFEYVPQGNYVIWALPFDSMGGYLPTFYGDVIYWEQATVVNLGVPQNPYNIHLLQATDLLSGPGGINGQINPGLKSASADKITMLLMNEQGQPVGYRRVNASGSFDFSALSYGTYYLKAELPGVTSDVVKVVIDAANPFASVVMTFTGNGILGINDPVEFVKEFITYPNPVNDLVNISLKMTSAAQVTVGLINLGGQMVKNGSYKLERGENRITLDLSGIASGLYTLRITSPEGISLTQKLVKTH